MLPHVLDIWHHVNNNNYKQCNSLKSSSLPYSCFAFVKKQKETQRLFNKGLGVSLIFKEVFKLQVLSTLNNINSNISDNDDGLCKITERIQRESF